MHTPFEVGVHHRGSKSDILWARLHVPGLESAVARFATANGASNYYIETRVDNTSEYRIEFPAERDIRGLEQSLLDELERVWHAMNEPKKD